MVSPGLQLLLAARRRSLQIGQTKPVTHALIPAASFSQQLFPASKSLPPALFPVLDTDGILKPAILILVEEALEAGIHSVVIVVSPVHRKDFEEIFHNQLDIRDFNRLPPRLRQYAAQLWRNYGAILCAIL